MADKGMARGLEEQVELLMQGTDYGDAGLSKAMATELGARLEEAKREARPLRVYCGFDPRTADLHIGHTVPMRKLRQFQDLGHDVTFLVGTYTSLVGDPSDKDRLRPRLTQDEVMANARTYAEQAFRILDPARTTVRYNHEWLEGIRLGDLIEIASHFSVQQFLTRDAFRKRWENGDALYLHEMLYAVMQAVDACTLGVDVQVGGSDQLFNIVTASRKLMAARGMRPNVAVIVGILPGTDGTTKMSKSLGNHIRIMATPEEMYGKLMSIPDAAMRSYFAMATRLEPAEIRVILEGISSGSLHPRDAKRRLAREIVSIFASDEAAEAAEAAFVKVFTERRLPTDMPEAAMVSQEGIAALLVRCGLASSRSDARRLLAEGAVRLDDVRLQDAMSPPPGPGVLRVGRKFVRLTGG
jgi:tyrosyl-tRNA synthetase